MKLREVLGLLPSYQTVCIESYETGDLLHLNEAMMVLMGEHGELDLEVGLIKTEHYKALGITGITIEVMEGES